MISDGKTVSQVNKLAIWGGGRESATVDGSHLGVLCTENIWSETEIMRQKSALQKSSSVELNNVWIVSGTVLMTWVTGVDKTKSLL